MKNTSILISLLAITTLNIASIANAKNKGPEINEKAVNAKCFVELVGGGETISLWVVKPSLLKELPHTIVGQEILLIPTHYNRTNKKKATIYKVKQCVLAEDDFGSPRAKIFDKGLPR
jgi:hypothetical protein